MTPLPRGGLGTDFAVERRVPALGKAPLSGTARALTGPPPEGDPRVRLPARRSAGSPASTKTRGFVSLKIKLNKP